MNQLQVTSYKLRAERGFTLIELLVVVTIMIVLSMVAMLSFAGASKKSRDARRTADLEKIRIALEIARQTGSTYPANLTILETGNYLSKVPADPKPTGSYRYAQVSSYSYTLDSQMEDLGSTTGSYPPNGYNYRVVNP